MYPEFFHGSYIWWFMPLMHMAGGIIFIIIVCFVVRGIFGGRGVCHKEHETPLEILKKRYARGEITRDEFQRMKEDLDK